MRNLTALNSSGIHWSHKMPSTNPCRHVRSRLGQYSSGEDDSGAEELVVPRQDLKCNDVHSCDLKRNTCTPQAYFLKQSGQTSFEGSNFQVVGARMNHNKKHITKPPAANVRNHSGGMFRKTYSCHQPHCGKSRIWKRQASLNSVMQCESSESDDSQKANSVHPTSESNSFDSGHKFEKISLFSEDQSVRTLDCRRRVLSDITREAVAGFSFQKPSYYSRDVLPLEANHNAHTFFTSRVNETSCAEKNWKQGHFSPNGIHTVSRQSPSHGSLDISSEFKTMEEKGWFSLHYQKVSMILVTVVLLFFMALGIIYLSFCFKDASKNIPGGQGDFYPLCGADSSDPTACIEKSKLSTTLNILQVLTPKLMSLAVDFHCNSTLARSLSMPESEVLEYIIQNVQDEAKDAHTHIRNLKLLILSNPHWKVKLFSGQAGRDEGTRTETSGKVTPNGAFMFEEPVLPYSCQLNLLFCGLYSVGSISLPLLVAVFFAVCGLLIGVRHYNRLCEHHRQNVYMLVNKIIATLRNHHRQMQLTGKNGHFYLTVEKCKSEIIHPSSCKRLMSAWKDAEKFIDNHESRILSDVLRIQEQSVKVWQWQSTTSSANGISLNMDTIRSPKNSTTEERDVSIKFSPVAHSSPVWNSKTRRKVWQGQAFETNAGSPNSLPFSPTPCLKIRHMFDPELENGDEWPILIQDSILEKCENTHILHLYVDHTSQEGCVFMKCASSEEAGKAYRALHGWWFDTKLVTVKYLRTERYHERFPEAVWASHSLRPSNNKRLSLQELWKSPSESI